MDATVRIYADGRLIETFVQGAQALPRDFRLFVEGARLITVEVSTVGLNRHVIYALDGFAE